MVLAEQAGVGGDPRLEVSRLAVRRTDPLEYAQAREMWIRDAVELARDMIPRRKQSGPGGPRVRSRHSPE